MKNVKQLKKELHVAIDAIKDEDLLNAVYTILNKGTYDYELSEGYKKVLKERLKAHEEGHSYSIPWKRTIKKIKGTLDK